ncbi:heavy metal-associated isoprenylated plant protein 7-like [Tripterygium wilfordii]|uniref:heavy metal-associated isoprenylated plant protein 7-like n=1 Tax=Tripterygium wilfordii TaxID=458696 RepID=UPI0018F7F827|nr:heavy metal-associated isoprenylated plant protein 7-like [Tripterygium wilfordii]
MKTAFEKIEKLKLNFKEKVSSSFIKKKKVVRPSPEEYEQNGIIVGVKYDAHCPQCSKEIEKHIKKMNGVLEVNSHLKESECPSEAEVTVEGVFDPTRLMHHITNKTKKAVKIYVKEEKPRRKPADGSSPSDNGGGNHNEIREEEEEEEVDNNQNHQSGEIEEVKE